MKIDARSALIAGASLLALATGARAESQPAATALASAADASTTTVVQDVVVTATRQSTRIQKTPVAVSVIGQNLIASQNIVTTRDLAGQVPGVTIQRSGITPTTQVFFIRGIGNSDPIFDPNVAVYVDDVYLSTRFDDFPNAAFSGGHFLSVTGNQLPFSPAWQTSFAVAYRLPVDVHGDIRLGGDVTYESSYFSDLFNYKQGKVPSQAYLDAFVSYAPRDSNFKFSLTAKNLTNNIAYQSITWGGTPNLWQGPVSPPRTVFFKISYSR